MEYQNACLPIQEEFGTPPDVDLMTHPDFADTVEHVAMSLESAHSYLDTSEGAGEAARKVIATLGCAGCKLEVCSVNDVLEQHVAQGKADRLLRQKTTMFETAPRWLSVARLNQPDIQPETLKKLREAASSSSPQTTEDLMKSGDLDLDELLGDVSNEFNGLYTKQELPELAAIANVSNEATVTAHSVTTKNSDTFLVIDASDAVGFHGESAPPRDYAILATKLLDRMSERDSSGKPQILSADNKMQKPIYKLGGVPVFELRMNGKNRMYIAVDSSQKDGQPYRITILGSHGGDAATQRAFLDTALAA